MYYIDIMIDPSGLYSIVSSYNDNDRHVDTTKDRSTTYANNTMMMIEIGTGNRVGCIDNLFDISDMCMSDDSSHIVLGSSRGHIGIYSLDRSYTDNITEVLEQMKVNPKFWNEYPIIYNSDNMIDNNDISSDSNVSNDDDNKDIRSHASHNNNKKIKIGYKTIDIDDKKKERYSNINK